MGSRGISAEALFAEPGVYAGEDQGRQLTRALALGGVLQTLRAREGWSVEQAAVHAGIGHMTWRRVEDGYTVRTKTYAALDRLLGLPFGTTRRATGDDRVLVELMGHVGVDVSNVAPATAEAFVEQFAQGMLSQHARSTVAARASIATEPVRVGRRGRHAVGATAYAIPTLPGPPIAAPVQSDLEVIAAAMDRLARSGGARAQRAVAAIVDAMPELVQSTQPMQAVERETVGAS